MIREFKIKTQEFHTQLGTQEVATEKAPILQNKPALNLDHQGFNLQMARAAYQDLEGWTIPSSFAWKSGHLYTISKSIAAK